jgi:nucleotide-binding universal stress UspA family protein
MFSSILLPLDGSALSARAMPFAKRLAQAGGVRLIVVRAHLPVDDDLSLRLEYPGLSLVERAEVERRAAEAEFQLTVDGLRNDGLEVESHFVEGVAADVIFDTAEATRANLIVMSTHGHGGLGRWLYGSVADEVLRRMPVPVLLVSAVCTQTAWAENKPARVVVPLDGSSLASEALRPARDLATALGGEMLLLAVVEPTAVYPDGYLERSIDLRAVETQRASHYLDTVATAQRTASAVPPVSTRVAHGDAAAEICAVAREVGADAIAMGRTGVVAWRGYCWAASRLARFIRRACQYLCIDR